MLEERYAGSRLSGLLVSKKDFRPFPTVSERAEWERLPDRVKERIIEEGERYLEFAWEPLPASWYMDFVRKGERGRYEGRFFRRRAALISLLLAECVEDQGRFLDQIIDGIWCICEESSWAIPAHITLTPTGREDKLPDVEAEYPYIDLFAAETASLLAWVSYFLKDRLDSESRLIDRRIKREVAHRVFRPYLEVEDFWWLGFEPEEHGRPNNWNPWCNANCLAAFLVLEEDPDVRLRAVRKCMRSLDRFIEGYPEDGGCDEGPSYWGAAGAALFDCLELLHLATGGAVDVYSEPLIQEIGRYINRVHIADRYYVSFADASAIVNIPAGLVYRYGLRIGDSALTALGLYSMAVGYHEGNWFGGTHVFRALCDVFSSREMTSSSAEPPYESDAWLKDTHVMVARERGGDVRGLYLTAKGGHNAESHNHNDVGQFMVYSDGKPVIIDPGVGDYTAKTFSPRRYEIWTMQSAYHNLPTVNGVQQRPGLDARAENVDYSCDAASARFCLDIAGTYPNEAGITEWRRCCTLHRGDDACVEIVDEFRLSRLTDDITMSLMTCCEHDLGKPGVIAFKVDGGKDVVMTYDASALSATSERIDIVDKRLLDVWGDHIYRITLRSKNAIDWGKWVLRFEQAVDRNGS